MANIHMKSKNCGTVIACGAASVHFDHKPGDPTSVDKLVAAVKHLVRGRRSNAAAGAAK